MAGKTVNILFNVSGDAKSLDSLVKSSENLKTALKETFAEAEKLPKSLDFAAISQSISNAAQGFDKLYNAMSDLSKTYQEQEVNETRLATVMKQRMNASAEDVQSIKDLTTAQQRLGVIGDEVQLAGAQQVATFINQKSSLETLIPAMNNLIAQQKGMNATSQDAITIGNLLGKAMQGQVSALKRVGITFTDAQAQVMQFGTEEERAAMLAQIITDNVGNMNNELAKTSSGQIKQLDNALGDVKEMVGAIAQSGMPFVSIANSALQTASSVAMLTLGLKSMGVTMKTTRSGALALSVGMKTLTISLRGVLIATGVGAALVGLTTVIEKLMVQSTAASQGLDDLSESEQTLRDETSRVQGELDSEASKLKALMDANEDTTDAVKHLNTAYGNIFGSHKTAAEWYDVLTTKSKEYALQLGYEAQAKQAAAKIAANTLAIEAEQRKQQEMIESGTAQKKVYSPGTIATAGSGTDMSQMVDTKAYAASKRAVADLEAENKRLTQTVTDANNHYVELGQSIKSAMSPTATQETAKATGEVTRAAEAHNSVQLEYIEGAKEKEEIEGNIRYLLNEQKHLTAETAGENNAKLKHWREELEKIDKAMPRADNLSLDVSVLGDTDLSSGINFDPSIKGADDLAEAIEGVGEEMDKLSTSEAVLDSWSSIKNIGSSIENMTDALSGNQNAWSTITSVVDGAIGIWQGISSIIGIINGLSTANEVSATTTSVAMAAQTAAASEKIATAPAEVAAATSTAAAYKLEADAVRQLAAAKMFEAVAYIPFAGAALGAASVATMTSTLAALKAMKFAEGGIAYGPTLGLFGEYANASSNPEVVAPLDKLRNMLGNAGGAGETEFRIRGRDLYAILNNESNRRSRR